jgi:hypothetical protein
LGTLADPAVSLEQLEHGVDVRGLGEPRPMGLVEVPLGECLLVADPPSDCLGGVEGTVGAHLLERR